MDTLWEVGVSGAWGLTTSWWLRVFAFAFFTVLTFILGVLYILVIRGLARCRVIKVNRRRPLFPSSKLLLMSVYVLAWGLPSTWEWVWALFLVIVLARIFDQEALRQLLKEKSTRYDLNDAAPNSRTSNDSRSHVPTTRRRKRIPLVDYFQTSETEGTPSGDDMFRSYPSLSKVQIVHVTASDRIRRFAVLPLKVVFYCFIATVWVLIVVLDLVAFRGGILIDSPWARLGPLARVLVRQKPNVLICMPFGFAETEIAYSLVVKPVIERKLGGTCFRLDYPIDCDWEEHLRFHMFRRHAIIFDLSFNNENVQREKRFAQQLLARQSERAQLFICWTGDESHPRAHLGETVQDEIEFYTCTKACLDRLAKYLHENLVDAFADIGFRRGWLDPLVLYPKPPPEYPDDVEFVSSAPEFFHRTDAWVKDQDLDNW